MAHLKIKNVSIKGIVTCVPSTIEENIDYPYFKEGEAEKVIASTGIKRRHIADVNTTSGDLCYKAAEKLLSDLSWTKEDVDCLIFVSQSPDYKLPSTSCVLHGKLGLKETCYTLDISYGCPGWLYGLSVISSLMTSGLLKRGLLLVGDTPSKFKSRKDKTAWPLFGDAGSATALEFSESAKDMFFTFSTEGKSCKAIMIPDGGARNPVTMSSFKEETFGEGIVRTPLDSVMDGMSVFSFGIKRAPESIQDILSFTNKNINDIDLFVMHQANLFMNEKIRKKLKIPAEKVPYSLQEFGNTSCVTLPLTLCYKRELLLEKNLKIIATAFGVGLSWGCSLLELDSINCLSLIQYEN